MSKRSFSWGLVGSALVVGLGAAALVSSLSRPSDRARAAHAASARTVEAVPLSREEPASVPAEHSIPPRAEPPVAKPIGSTASSAEASLMAELRALAKSDPAGAIELARDGNRRFPDSTYAPERASILIHALAATDHPSEARGEAEDMVNRYPDSDWVREIELFTGAHRHRNIEVGPDGRLRYR